MTDIEASMNKVEMTAEIVSAYVEHNSVPAGELATLIKSVHDSLGLLFDERKAEAEPEPLHPKVPIKKVDHGRVSRLLGGRQAVQIAEASPARGARPFA